MRASEVISEENRRAQDFVDFGEIALSADDLEELLDMAIRNVAKGLDSQFGKILVPTEDGSLRVVAGIGWQDGVVGTATLPGDIESPAGYALKTGRPVRSNNLAKETRFKTPQLLMEHNIESAINVIISGADGPFGVLEVDSTNVREFSAVDTNFMMGYAQLLSGAIHRVRQTEKLQESAKTNEILLEELHHRIGNDFQLVSSLINFRKRSAKSADAKAELSWVMNRLKGLSALHTHLRQSNSVSHVALDEYLASLVTELEAAHQFTDRSIELDLKLESWTISAREAVSVGLIVNEFISNSIEHAFGVEGGKITLRLEREGNKARLLLADNGKGFDASAPSDRSGIGLIDLLASTVSSDVTHDTIDGVRLELVLDP